MSSDTRLGDTTVILVERAADVSAAVREQLRQGEEMLCVDASELSAAEADAFVEAIEECARMVNRRGGHLSVVCSLAAVRRRLWNGGTLVLSDRSIAQAVLG